MKRQDAEEYTQALGQIVAGGWRQVALGKRLGVPQALGLTVQEWVEQRLGGYVRMSVAERRDAVTELAEEGCSQRGIAQVIGVTPATVNRDLKSGVPNETPDSPAETEISDTERPAGGVGVTNETPADAAGGHREGPGFEPDPAPHPLDAIGALAVGEIRDTEARRVAARTRQPEPVAEPVPPPPGKYQCVVIDPPWPMQKIERDERPNQGAALDYPVMSIEDIADERHVPVRTLAADDCHIYLWVTHKYLPSGLELLRTWGFNYQCAMTWRKNVGITPFSWMYDTEHVLFGRRGNLPLQRLGLRLSFDAPVRGHSVKPDVFYQRVLDASPGPRVEMFARRERDGFTPWGNEVTHAVV